MITVSCFLLFLPHIFLSFSFLFLCASVSLAHGVPLAEALPLTLQVRVSSAKVHLALQLSDTQDGGGGLCAEEVLHPSLG